MTDLTHLIGRLREIGGGFLSPLNPADTATVRQAADALQSLTARVAELETKASLQWSAIEGAAALNAEKMRRIADLEAALLKICRTHGPAAPASDGGTYILDSSSAREMLIIARKALNPVEGE